MPISMAPPAVIEINDDLSDQVLNVLITQLFIDQVMYGYTFDGYVAANSLYPMSVKLANNRILVLRDLSDYTNRNYFDLVLFAKAGLVSVLWDGYGPPSICLPIAKVSLIALFELNSKPCPGRRRRRKCVLDNDLVNPHDGWSITRQEWFDDEEEDWDI
jgi:hypothetical protein